MSIENQNQGKLRRGCLAACLSMAMAAPWAIAVVPELPQVKLIAQSEKLPLGSAKYPGANFIELDRYGYTEEEYYLTGKAAVRDEKGGVTVADAPYTTRLLIRRPKDRKKFSGNIIITPFNWAQETAREWAFTKFYLLNHSDVFIGVSNIKQEIPGFPGQHGIKLLKNYDPIRYGPLNVYDDQNGKRNDMPQGHDLLAQLAWLIKSNAPTSPLTGLKVERIIAFAEGVQADVFQHYVGQGRHNEFRMPDGKPLYDAYLLGAYHLLPPPEPTQRSDAAYVIIQHQREIHRDAKDKVVAPVDTDQPKFRLYDFVGSAHMGAVPIGSYNELTVNLDAPELTNRAAGLPPATDAHTPAASAAPPGPPGGARPPRPAICSSGNSEPSGLVFIALLDDLKQWIKTNKPMPHAPRADRETDAEKIDSVTGNATGGLRPPWVEIPAATYLTGDVVGCGGSEPMTRFGADQLVKLYGSYENYLKKFEAARAQFVKDGFLLPEDMALMKPSAKPENFVAP